MTFSVREMGSSDSAAWLDMRDMLWPAESPSEHVLHVREVEAMLAGDDAWGFIAESIDGQPAAFAEVSIRSCANGCDSRPIPFLEGMFVRPQYRRQGVGAQLIAHIETFLIARGFHEFGSDALIDNHQSHAAHHSWGFSETERVVYFRKFLNGV
jgi:aminoglycoside 6'-N-acetyltransferase I